MKIVLELSTPNNIQPFKEISENFVCMAIKIIDEKCDQLTACITIFRETLVFFKHIPKTGTIDECTSSQFFELWSPFAGDFHDLWKKEIVAINTEL